MTKQIVRLAINSINVSPPASKHIIVSLTSPGTSVLVEFVVDKKYTTRVPDGATGLTPAGLREIITQLGMEVEEAHFQIEDFRSEAVVKRQSRRKT